MFACGISIPMIARLGQALCVAALFASAPAYAAEEWDCPFIAMPNILGGIKFQIDGQTLDMLIIPANVKNLSGRQKKVLESIVAAGRDHVQYQVLENNDVGVVAAKSPPLVGAAIITIKKATGELRILEFRPQLPPMMGLCKLNSASP